MCFLRVDHQSVEKSEEEECAKSPVCFPVCMRVFMGFDKPSQMNRSPQD